MCVAIYKPQGVIAPSLEVLKSCWDANPDGAGIGWRVDGKYPIHIEKGFMVWSDFERYWKSTDMQSYDGDLFIHFRITTHGGTSAGNTHPFPVCNSDTILKSTTISCNHMLMHNGVLPITPDNKSISDTMMLCKLIARGGFEKTPTQLMDLLEDLIGTNKIALMDKDDVYLVGLWKDIDGVKYSNTYWQYRQTISSYWGDCSYSKPSDTRSEVSATNHAAETDACGEVIEIDDNADPYDFSVVTPTSDELKYLRNGICPWCDQSTTLDEYEDCWCCNDCFNIFAKPNKR